MHKDNIIYGGKKVECFLLKLIDLTNKIPQSCIRGNPTKLGMPIAILFLLSQLAYKLSEVTTLVAEPLWEDVMSFSERGNFWIPPLLYYAIAVCRLVGRVQAASCKV